MLMFRMGDIFALATTLYEISTGQKPFQEKSDDEISALFRSQTYPDLQNLSPPGLGDIIRSCWLERYAVAEQVVCDLRLALRPDHDPSDNGQKALTKLLLDEGTSPDAKDKDRRTPLLWAAEKGQWDTMKVAELNFKDETERTPLPYMAEKGCEATVKMLLEKDLSLPAASHFRDRQVSSHEGQLLSLTIHMGSRKSVEVRDNEILTCLWAGGLDTSCMVCYGPIHGDSDLLIRTISLATPIEDLRHGSTSTKMDPFANIELRIHNRHFGCVKSSSVTFIPISHVWHQQVAEAYLTRRQDDRRAADYAVQIPFRVLLAVSEAYGRSVEIWHDYISVPQWQYNVQQRLIASLPVIFSWPSFALMHLDDVTDACVEGLKCGSTAEELVYHVNMFLRSQWFRRMWVCMEYARSRTVHLLTESYTVIKSSKSLFLEEMEEARGEMQQKLEPDKYWALISSAPPFRWETWKGLLRFKKGIGCSFGAAVGVLADKNCRTYRDRFIAINVLLGLDIDNIMLPSTATEACRFVAWKSLERGDYTPLLLAPCGELEVPDSPWLRGHENMKPWIWTLREVWQPADDLMIIRANHIMPKLKVVGILTEWQYQSFEDFEAVIRKVVQNTGANAKDFTNTIARLYIDQNHDLLLDKATSTFQQSKYRQDGTYMIEIDSKDTDKLEKILSVVSAVPRGGDSALLNKLTNLLGLADPAVGSESRLSFGARVAPRYHGMDKDTLASVRCKLCLKTSTFRMALWTDPGHNAQVYRIPGLWLQRSLPNGVGLVISAGRIVGRLVYGTPSCECHVLETVQIV